VQAAGGTPLSDQPSAPDEPPAGPRRPRRVGLLFAVAAFVLTADIISKAIAVAHIREYSQIHLIGSVLMLTLTRNGGAAFSIGTSETIVFTAIAVGVIIYILRTARDLRSIGWAITLGMLLGGAAGNLTDRIFRAPAPFRGDVIDWIQLPHWPVFNLADSSIVCAGFLVVLLALRGIRLDGTRLVPGRTRPVPTRPVPGSVSTGPVSTGPVSTGPVRQADPQPDSPAPDTPK
jgi:lipoprotein signal peptidase